MSQEVSKMLDDLRIENNRLKKCFAEIKEIMKKHCKKCKRDKFYYFQLCCTCKYTDILQKIREWEQQIKVEGEHSEG